MDRAVHRILDHMRGHGPFEADLKFLLHLIDISVSPEQDWRELLRQPTHFGVVSSLA